MGDKMPPKVLYSGGYPLTYLPTDIIYFSFLSFSRVLKGLKGVEFSLYSRPKESYQKHESNFVKFW